VLKESTSEIVTDMLVEWVEVGAAIHGWVEWYSIAWKTWTAQIVYKWEYQSGAWYTNGSYAGFAPAEDPQFVIIVKLERPRTSEWWGSTASYIFSDIAKELLGYYGIPKKQIVE
jgi:cell division protein FtsI (penicillin-binding protein 3)